MIMGEQERVSEVWSYFAQTGNKSRIVAREWLLELNNRNSKASQASKLRLATARELELVMPVQAQLAFEESAVDPRQSDPSGFRSRCLRRIQQERTWVIVEDDQLSFKADVISEAPDVMYLEGIWAKEEYRGNGYAERFMLELTDKLLHEVDSICLLANESNKRAISFYRKCGFQFRSTYETIFLAQKEFIAN
jgi:predicted GNAT family acetyltransferase